MSRDLCVTGEKYTHSLYFKSHNRGELPITQYAEKAIIKNHYSNF